VKALRDRLVRFGVSEERFRVDTIAGWCLRYVVYEDELQVVAEPFSDTQTG